MSAHIGLFYGSTTGHTDAIAELIRDEFGRGMVKLHCMAETKKQDFANYNYLIIGSPTWHIGKLQSDWEAFFPELDEIDFNGKQVAYFGLGDQLEYPCNFLDAMGILAKKITSRGGVRVGSWSAVGYNFQESKALIGSKFTQLPNGSTTLLESKLIQLANGIDVDGEFVGLAIDEENQPELTEERIKIWVTQIRQMMGA
jgi:flavodoxin I